MRFFTRDRESAEVERRRFYTVESLGEKRHLTPEGFLVCEDVPLARTGEQIYGPFDGVPIPPGPDGVIYVMRTEAEVFRPETMASANGKDVCDEHPADDVSPENFHALSCGTILNPRRGRAEDNQGDLLIGDLIIKRPSAIKAVLDGKSEVSLGYDADYVKTGPGKGEQRNLLINHVALVDRGRCGPRCSIGDRIPFPTQKSEPVKTTDCGCKQETSMKKTFRDRVRDALKATGLIKDEDMDKTVDSIEEATKEVTKDADPGNIHVHMAGSPTADAYCTKDEFEAHKTEQAAEHQKTRDSIEALRGELAASKAPTADEKAEAEEKKETEEVKDEISEEVEEEKKGEAEKARDSAYLEGSYTQTLADAEILVPGIVPPKTFDKAAAPVRTYKDGICGMRRTALDMFYNTQEGRSFIDQQLAGRAFAVRDSAAFPCRRVTDMFRAAVAYKKATNNSKAGGGNGNHTVRTGDRDRPAFGSVPVISADRLARQAAEAWGQSAEKK